MLGGMSAFAEARLYRTVVEEINPHVGRYLLVALAGSAGMFHASVGKYTVSKMTAQLNNSCINAFIYSLPSFLICDDYYHARFLIRITTSNQLFSNPYLRSHILFWIRCIAWMAILRCSWHPICH